MIGKSTLDESFYLVSHISNQVQICCFENVGVSFQPEGAYDNSPSVLCVYPDNEEGRKPFRFFYMQVQSTQFMTVFQEVWSRPVRGCHMYKVVQKLRWLKTDMKQINKMGFSDVQVRATQSHHKWIQVQDLVHSQPGNSEHSIAEKVTAEKYQQAQAIYLSFLTQKAKAR